MTIHHSTTNKAPSFLRCSVHDAHPFSSSQTPPTLATQSVTLLTPPTNGTATKFPHRLPPDAAVTLAHHDESVHSLMWSNNSSVRVNISCSFFNPPSATPPPSSKNPPYSQRRGNMSMTGIRTRVEGNSVSILWYAKVGDVIEDSVHYIWDTG